MKFEKKSIFFLIGIILLSIKAWMDSSALIEVQEIFDTIILLASYVFFSINIIIEKPKIKYIIISAILIGLGTIIYKETTYTGFLTLVLVIISARNVDIKTIIKIVMIINLILLGIHIAMYVIYLMFDFSNLNFLVRTSRSK